MGPADGIGKESGSLFRDYGYSATAALIMDLGVATGDSIMLKGGSILSATHGQK